MYIYIYVGPSVERRAQCKLFADCSAVSRQWRR